MKKEKSCGAIIINKENKILLIKHNQGHWSFPKGHTEEGETEIQTALREVKEETGLNIKIIDSIKEISTYNPKENVIKDVVFFLGLTNRNKVILQESEVCEYLWLTYNDSLKYLTYENDKQILKKIYSKYIEIAQI